MILYHELVLTKREFVRNCSAVKLQWLLDIAPHFFKGVQDLGDKDDDKKKLPKAGQGKSGLEDGTG